jgi:hypothetical protein
VQRQLQVLQQSLLVVVLRNLFLCHLDELHLDEVRRNRLGEVRLGEPSLRLVRLLRLDEELLDALGVPCPG